MNWLPLWLVGLLVFLLFPSAWMLLALAITFVALPLLVFDSLISPRR